MIKAEIASLTLQEAVDRLDRAFLAFSGGKESVVLADLLMPWRDKVSLLWVNTGFMFPHMAEFVRSYRDRFKLIELKSDLLANWRDHGIPARMLPIANGLPEGHHTEPKLQPWISCCRAVRAVPVETFLQELQIPAVLFHGQRGDDRSDATATRRTRPFGWPFTAFRGCEGVEVQAPLAEWSTSDVMAYVDERRIKLPEQYPVSPNSLECWSCTAEHTRDRVEYMRRRYPEYLKKVVPGWRQIQRVTAAAVTNLAEMIDAAEGQAKLKVVRQRGNGDCLIASLATVTSQRYEAIAQWLGYPVDPNTGLTSKSPRRGLVFAETIAPLLAHGWSATHLVSREKAPHTLRMVGALLPDAEQIKAAILGRRALVNIPGQPGELHCIPWTGSEAIDCSDGATLALGELEVAEALVLERLPAAISTAQSEAIAN